MQVQIGAYQRALKRRGKSMKFIREVRYRTRSPKYWAPEAQCLQNAAAIVEEKRRQQYRELDSHTRQTRSKSGVKKQAVSPRQRRRKV